MPVTFSGANIAAQNTAWSNNLGPDGYTWANANQIVVDQYNCVIISLEDNSGNHKFVISNDNGATWFDNTGTTGNGQVGSAEVLLGRRGVALDTTNDILHSLCACSGASDGALYRRYIISRDVNHHITAINRDYNINFQLEYQAGISNHNFESPVALWLDDAAYGAHGALVCFWTITDGTTAEIHASMRVLDNTANDQNATLWTRLDGGSTSTGVAVVSNDNVPVTVIASSSHLYQVSVVRKRATTHINDLCVYYHESSASGSLYWRRYPWQSGTNNWGAPIAPVAVTPTTRAGTNTGSSQQYQVLTRPSEDATHDRVYIGCVNWKDNTNGDTFSFAYVDTSDVASALVDVYSCGGIFTPTLYALTGQIGWDTTSGTLLCTYIHSGGVGFNRGYIRAYNPDGTAASTEYEFITTQDVDIPDFWQNPVSGTTRMANNANNILVAFRNTAGQAPPYTGYAGTISVASGTATYTDTVSISSLVRGTFLDTIPVAGLAQGTYKIVAPSSGLSQGTFLASAGVVALTGNARIIVVAASGVTLFSGTASASVVALVSSRQGLLSVDVSTITNLHGSATARGVQGAMIASIAGPVPMMRAGIRPVLIARGHLQGG